MIKLIKNWWLNRKIEKEWVEWREKNSELNIAVPRDWNKNLPKIKLYDQWRKNDE
tara:strand:+ start:834 stop:998 length:165 start_codon:yes stop_codon:yes gene_type:complete